MGSREISLPCTRHGVGGGVEGQVGKGEQAVGIARLAAGHGPDAREKLVKVKGLDQIVVCPKVEALDAVRNGITRREEEHGGIHSPVSQRLDELVAVHAGHHDVEQNGVILRAEQAVERLLAVEAAVHAVAVFLECFDNQPIHVLRVFHDQDFQKITSFCRPCGRLFVNPWLYYIISRAHLQLQRPKYRQGA